jgi:GTP-binding protein
MDAPRIRTWRRCSTDRRACAAAGGDPDAPFTMLATTLEADPYLGRVLTGRIHSGVARSTCR